MAEKRANPDVEIAGIAARQHGVVTLGQLLRAGVSKDGVTGRVRSGRLHRIHRGIYAVGHPRLSNEGTWLAAVLGCGDGAALSHRSAAELWNLLPAHSGIVDVTVPGSGGRRARRGIRLHRSLSLTHAVATGRDGIRVTTPARTIADLRRFAAPEERSAGAPPGGGPGAHDR